MIQALVRKSCPYSSDQLVEASNVGFTDQFKIKTRGTMRTVGSLKMAVNGFARPWYERRDLSWMKE